MEMIEQNDFKRPMYFCATVGNDYYLGLEPWMELTGLTYQIMPTRSADGQPRVNSEKMYEVRYSMIIEYDATPDEE